MTLYHLESKSQHSNGGGYHRFGGPDTYVAVQCVPPGAIPLASLQRHAAQCRGISIKYFGEGYSRHTGPKSSLGKAIAQAQAWIAAE